MKKQLITLALIVVFAVTPVTTNAMTTAEMLAQIQSLMQVVQQLQAQLGQMNSGAVQANPVTQNNCENFTHTLSLGKRDNVTGGEVSKLQRFLTRTGDYYGLVGGYFGPATQKAVQSWQRNHGVVSYGTPESTGYGVVGPGTRGKMRCQIEGEDNELKMNLSLSLVGDASIKHGIPLKYESTIINTGSPVSVFECNNMLTSSGKEIFVSACKKRFIKSGLTKSMSSSVTALGIIKIDPKTLTNDGKKYFYKLFKLNDVEDLFLLDSKFSTQFLQANKIVNSISGIKVATQIFEITNGSGKGRLITSAISDTIDVKLDRDVVMAVSRNKGRHNDVVRLHNSLAAFLRDKGSLPIGIDNNVKSRHGVLDVLVIDGKMLTDPKTKNIYKYASTENGKNYILQVVAEPDGDGGYYGLRGNPFKGVQILTTISNRKDQLIETDKGFVRCPKKNEDGIFCFTKRNISLVKVNNGIQIPKTDTKKLLKCSLGGEQGMITETFLSLGKVDNGNSCKLACDNIGKSTADKRGEIVKCYFGNNSDSVLNTYTPHQIRKPVFDKLDVSKASPNVTLLLNASDKDDSNINYTIVWGDGIITYSDGPMQTEVVTGRSGIDKEVVHRYNKSGEYKVVVWARSEFGGRSTERSLIVDIVVDKKDEIIPVKNNYGKG